MKVFLGLDSGGTATKAALYDARGREIGVSITDTAVFNPKPGFAERDMEGMWLDNCAVIRNVLKKTGVTADEVAGVAICGHGKGLYLWGRDGRPTRKGILSTDHRAQSYVQKWVENGTEKKTFSRSCQHIMACQPVALLAWLQDHEPETVQNIQWIFECKDYLRFRLTGEARAEITDYSGANVVNLHTGGYDAELMALFGLSTLGYALPPLCGPTEIAGYVTREAATLCGLREGTPVAGGMFDIDACAIAVNVLDERNICMIAGTWSINEYPSREPVLDGTVQMNSLFCVPGFYLIEESSSTSAGNNEWFVKNLLPEVNAQAKAQGGSVYDVMNAWVEEVPANTFVPIFLPFLTGGNVNPDAKGAFIGLTAGHTRAHLARSVYEGIVFSHRYHLEKLLATRSSTPDCIRLAGGAAKSKVWTQMFADILEFPVETVDVNETGALGCAIAAAVATGEYATLEEAARNMCPISARVYPNPEHREIYRERYALYRRTINCLDGVWDAMNRAI